MLHHSLGEQQKQHQSNSARLRKWGSEFQIKVDILGFKFRMWGLGLRLRNEAYTQSMPNQKAKLDKLKGMPLGNLKI